MALFDALIGELASKFNLGTKAGPLVSELLRFMTNQQQGGFTGFLDRFKTAGLGNMVASWISKGENLPLSAPQVDQILGSSVITSFANKLGLGGSVISSALAYAIPKIINLVTPDGVAPTGVPAAISSFLGQGTTPAAPRVEPAKVAAGGMPKWVWLLPLLALLGLGWYFLSGKPEEKVATAPPVVTQTAPSVQPKLALQNDNGVVTVSGVVKDDTTKTSIFDAIKAVFGEGKVKGDITVDPNAGPATWLTNLRAALASFTIPGLKALFDGNAINIGGLIPDADRNSIIASLKSLFGTDFNVSALADPVTDAVKSAVAKSAAALAGLQAGFGPKDVTDALNLSIVHFVTDSAEVAAYNRVLLAQAAAVLKQLPAGTVIEISGHTDSTGDPAANQTLSEQRAEAVRGVLIEQGVDPNMVTAKGYGATQPVASNDTPEGRFQNRRISYSVVE